MSHFTVLVIGNNQEEQLSHYDESIEVEEYEVIEVSQEDKELFRQYCIEDRKMTESVPFDLAYHDHGLDWNNAKWRKSEDGIWREYSTYNPKSKFDWYSLGGRWTGFFKVKENVVATVGIPGVFGTHAMDGFADQLLKKDIDIEGMYSEAVKNAEEDYNKFESVRAGRELPSWEEIRNKFDNIGQAQEEYRSHQVVKDLVSSGFCYGEFESYRVAKDEFINRKKLSCFVPFAVVKDGQWFERGNMGWWGMVSGELDKDEWNNKFYDLFNSSSDDTLLSIYDCHT